MKLGIAPTNPNPPFIPIIIYYLYGLRRFEAGGQRACSMRIRSDRANNESGVAMFYDQKLLISVALPSCQQQYGVGFQKRGVCEITLLYLRYHFHFLRHCGAESNHQTTPSLVPDMYAIMVYELTPLRLHTFILSSSASYTEYPE